MSLVPQKDSQVIGLLINKGANMKEKQSQKSYSLDNLMAVHNLEASEIFDNLNMNEDEKNNHIRAMANQSFLMNPELITRLISRMTYKESFIR